jgi:PAS domain-containing protein
VPALRKDGTRVSVEFTIVPFTDDAGRMIGIAAILRDVTARFEELRALRKELAALSDGAKIIIARGREAGDLSGDPRFDIHATRRPRSAEASGKK